ncbi:hypothetical protein HYDPIDRAFT_129116 [Hydnomerulius pinastri MD-312]|nr:hypothetical protein HYDPIDRAFT_129116 [Hydnomerulius pinastri MD-312]
MPLDNATPSGRLTATSPSEKSDKNQVATLETTAPVAPVKSNIAEFLVHKRNSTKPSVPTVPSLGYLVFMGVILLFSYLGFFFAVSWLLKSTPLPIYVMSPFASVTRRFTGSTLADSSDGNEARTVLITVALLYYIYVYMFTSVMSVLAQVSASDFPYDNIEPRHNKYSMRSGLAHRIVSAHDGLYEFFPAFAFVTAITVCLLPQSASLQTDSSVVTIALPAITLHALVKALVWAPAYVVKAQALRSASHIMANVALLAALVAIVGADSSSSGNYTHS